MRGAHNKDNFLAAKILELLERYENHDSTRDLILNRVLGLDNN